MIYLDNSATTKPDETVIRSFSQTAAKYFANPSSIHNLGGEAERLLNRARGQIANFLQIEEEEIVFTSGGTEGNNLAIKGVALQHQDRGKHLITTEIEHPSVYETFKGLESLGFEVTYLPVNKEGVVSVTDVEKAIRQDTILISIMHVNNEIGSIQPVKEIGKIAQKHTKLYFHVDDVQGFGRVPLPLAGSGIDLWTMSGHKIHGVKGTGLLFVRKNIPLFPLLHGGGQEKELRSGTENLPGIVSLARAVRLIKEKEANEYHLLKKFQEYLHDAFQNFEQVCINSSEKGAPHIFNFSIPSFKPEVIIHELSEHGIYISTKSACSSKQMEESRILKACGLSSERSQSALRVSLSYENTMEELERFVEVMQKVIKQLEHK